MARKRTRSETSIVDGDEQRSKAPSARLANYGSLLGNTDAESHTSIDITPGDSLLGSSGAKSHTSIDHTTGRSLLGKPGVESHTSLNEPMSTTMSASPTDSDDPSSDKSYDGIDRASIPGFGTPSITLPNPPGPYQCGWRFTAQEHIPPKPTPITNYSLFITQEN
jgi:hypothetical protein